MKLVAQVPAIVGQGGSIETILFSLMDGLYSG